MIACAACLHWVSPYFSYETGNTARPLATFAAAYVLAALAWAWMTLYLLPATVQRAPSSAANSGDAASNNTNILLVIITAGLAARLLLFGSVPVQEDDFYRYLWDGALTANGINPWHFPPEAARLGLTGHGEVHDLASSAGLVLDRINYSDLTSIYPALAQAAFAAAYWLEPFSLDAWRGVLLVLELVVLGLLLAGLKQCGRPAVWCAVYWWNPIAIKEVINAAHMEPVMLVPMLAALVLAMQGRSLFASLAVSLAVAAKLWPALLFAIIWRPLVFHSKKLALQVLAASLLSGVLLAPMMIAAAGAAPSGVGAFATGWERISLPFMVLQQLAEALPTGAVDPGLLARIGVAVLIASAVLWSNRTAATNPASVADRFLIAAGAMLLLSPVQLPWYFLWVLPLLCLRPSPALVLAGVVFPVYYAFFALTARQTDVLWLQLLVWLMWLPVWCVLAVQAAAWLRTRHGTSGKVRQA